jgi:hypothetical protein
VVLNAQPGFKVEILNVDVIQFFMISKFIFQHIICPQIEKECELHCLKQITCLLCHILF